MFRCQMCFSSTKTFMFLQPSTPIKGFCAVMSRWNWYLEEKTTTAVVRDTQHRGQPTRSITSSRNHHATWCRITERNQRCQVRQPRFMRTRQEGLPAVFSHHTFWFDVDISEHTSQCRSDGSVPRFRHCST